MTSLFQPKSIPVLAFHAIGDGRGPVWMGEREFGALLDRMIASGYEPVLANDVGSFVATGNCTKKQPFAITFDDGYTSVITAALPMLSARRIPATVFVVTGASTNNWDAPGTFGSGLPLLRDEDVVELAEAGWEIGSHTHVHRRLVGVDPLAVLSEIAQSQQALARLQIAVKTMAYPYGHFDDASRRVVKSAGLHGFGIGASYASANNDTTRIDRVDSHYIRSPLVQRSMHNSVGRSYLSVRKGLRSVRSRVVSPEVEV